MNLIDAIFDFFVRLFTLVSTYVFYVIHYNTIKRRLIIFVRYPEVGKCKTRLIPSCGPQLACDIQQQMTQHISKRVRSILLDQFYPNAHNYSDNNYPPMKINIEIYYNGECTEEQMKQWLGKDFHYRKQPSGDLTQKLIALVDTQARNEHLVIIASDTPCITVDIIKSAFAQLSNHNIGQDPNNNNKRRPQVVIGPARDGGYYLIGLSRPFKELFGGSNDRDTNATNSNTSIPWSTDQVLAKTIGICQKRGIHYSKELPLLSDIDYPTDLPVWEEEKLKQWQRESLTESNNNNSSSNSNSQSIPLISVIIPVLNEGKDLRATLDAIFNPCTVNVEVIIVDGGSLDDTLSIATTYQPKGTNSISNSQYPIDIRVVHSEKGRSKQLNLGASHARGKILLFVHGDTRLPVGYDAMVRRCLVAGNQSRGRKRRVVAGAFSFEIEDKEQVLLNYGKAILEYSTNLRAKYLQMPYGDQCLFCWTDVFQSLHGFPKIALMEDFEFVRMIQRAGYRLDIIPVTAVTSGRRWKKLGLLRTTILNQVIICAYLIGVSPSTLLHWYYGKQD